MILKTLLKVLRSEANILVCYYAGNYSSDTILYRGKVKDVPDYLLKRKVELLDTSYTYFIYVDKKEEQ